MAAEINFEGASPATYPGNTVTSALTEERMRIEAAHKQANQALESIEDSGVNQHIHNMWWQLLRTPEHLILGGIDDVKMPWKGMLYISAKEDKGLVQGRINEAYQKVAGILEQVNTYRRTDIRKTDETDDEYAVRIADTHFESDIDKSIAWNLLRLNITNKKSLKVPKVEQLPDRGSTFLPAERTHGLLYVPYSYIVPGPRFNEMYGWDTAFVVRGLLQDGQFTLAKGLVDSMLYQIEHYGTVLNGNRTYYYDTDKSRSQPPLLTGKILSVFKNYDHLPEPKEDKWSWLRRAAEIAERYHAHWMTPPHYDRATGLSRYASNLGTPSGEVEYCEPEHYPQALNQLRQWHKRYVNGNGHGNGHVRRNYGDGVPEEERYARYYLERFYDAKKDCLTPEFYKGDRAMRESGFDPSERFGFFNADVESYLPVCLNSLRLHHEQGLQKIYEILQAHAVEEDDLAGEINFGNAARNWSTQAVRTERAMQRYLYDNGNEKGNQLRKPAFRDRFLRDELRAQFRLPQFRDYNFATAFFPMWVGAASPEQAADIVKHIYPALKSEFGIFTSDRKTGSQWDWPMVWAPLVIVATEALERYDYYYQALDIATGFLNAIAKDFQKTGKVYEKYNGKDGTSRTFCHVDKGYSENVEGFGWTNSAVIELQETVRRLKHKIQQKELEAPEVPVERGVKEEGRARKAKVNGGSHRDYDGRHYL